MKVRAEERELPVVERVVRRYEVLTEDGHLVEPEEMVAYRAAVRGETVKNTIQRVRSGNEAPRWLNLSATPLWVSGQRTGAVISLTDITQRKQAELELAKYRERLESTLGSITEGYYALDDRWQFVAANKVSELHFGMPLEALFGQNIWTLTGTSEDSMMRRKFEEARATNHPVHFEAESQVRAGYWGQLHLYPRGDLLDVYFSDVSERKQAEAAIRRSVTQLGIERDRLAVTLRSIGDAVISTDGAGRVELFNGVAEQLTGWTAEDARGRPIHEVFTIIDEESRQPAVSPVGRVLEEGVVLGLANHTALLARDGTERPIADSAAPIRDATGRVTGVVLVFRDQTEERRAEREIRESEARMRLLAEGLPQLVWTADEGGNLDYFNQRWRDYTGQANGRELGARAPSRGSRAGGGAMAGVGSAAAGVRGRAPASPYGRRVPLVPAAGDPPWQGGRGKGSLVRDLHRHPRPEDLAGSASPGRPPEGGLPVHGLARVPQSLECPATSG